MKMKKIAAFLLAWVMIFALTACGGSVDASDPNQGLWKATTAETMGLTLNVSELFGKGFTIELQDKGKCALEIDGKKAKGTWTLANGVFTVKGGGMECEGTLEKGTLILEDVMSMGITLVFEKEGGHPDAVAGGGGASAGSSGVVGFYEIVSMSSDGETYDSAMLKEFGVEYALELREDKTFILYAFGGAAVGTWKEDGTFSYEEDGEDVPGTFEQDGDTMKLYIGEADAGVEFIFARSNGTPPTTMAATQSGDEDDGDTTKVSDFLAWWVGDWYGYWYVDTAGGAYADTEGLDWDCYAVVEAEGDDLVTMYLWNDYLEMGTVVLMIDPTDGDSFMGGATAAGGLLFEEAVTMGDWIIRPGTDGVDDDTIVIEALFEEAADSKNYMKYKIVMRQWGTSWEDVAEKDRPVGYADWYEAEGRRFGNMLEELQDSSFDDGTELFIHPIIASRDTSRPSGSATSSSGGSILGQWEYESGGFIYTFKADGTGNYDMFGTDMPFTYEADDGKVSILYEGNSAPTDMEYRLDGDKLILVDFFGSDTVYIRK